MTESEAPDPAAVAANSGKLKTVVVIVSAIALVLFVFLPVAAIIVTKIGGALSNPYVFDGFEGTTWEYGDRSDQASRFHFLPNGDVRSQDWYGEELLLPGSDPRWNPSSDVGTWTAEGSTIFIHTPGESRVDFDADGQPVVVPDPGCDWVATLDGDHLEFATVGGQGWYLCDAPEGEYVHDPEPDS